MAGWLKGQVKEVLSGDSVVIIGGVSKESLAVAPEKRITLSSLVAPRLVRKWARLEWGQGTGQVAKLSIIPHCSWLVGLADRASH